MPIWVKSFEMTFFSIVGKLLNCNSLGSDEATVTVGKILGAVGMWPEDI